MTMAKIVILEGPDGSGKTTLANKLHNTYNFNIVKTGPPAPDSDTTVAYLDAIYAALSRPGHTVFDRLHLGEKIYGPLLRGIDSMGTDGFAVIQRVIASHGIRIVIACPPWETLIAGWQSKDDLLKTTTQLMHVYAAYLDNAVSLGLQVYDWTAPNASEVLYKLIGEDK